MPDDLAELSLLDRLDPANTEGLTARAGGSLAATAEPAAEAAVVAAILQVRAAPTQTPLSHFPTGKRRRLRFSRGSRWWARKDSNLGPAD